MQRYYTFARMCGMERLYTSERLEKLHRAILFLVPLVYVAALSFSFSDDWFPVDDPQELFYIRGLQSGKELLRTDVFGLFRPVKNLLFLLFDRLLPSIGVRGCRFIGVVVGVLSFFSVRALCLRILDDRWKALAAASVWLLSPTLVSSAAWLSCLNIQVMVAFAALSIVFHDCAWTTSRVRPSRVLLAEVFFFLALVSYEAAVSLLPIFILFDILLRPGRARSRTAWIVYASHAMVAVGYLTLRHLFIAATQVNGNFVDVNRWQIAVSSSFFLSQHAVSWFWPFGRFTVLGGYKWGDVSPWGLLVFWVVWMLAIVLVTRRSKQYPVLAFGLFFFLVGFAPVSNCLGLGNGPYFDCYLTLASIGLSIACIDIAWQLSEIQGTWRRASLVVVGLFFLLRVASIPEAMRWARLWSRGEAAFSASIRNFPKVFSNKLAFIQWLSDQGQYDEAFELAKQIESSIGTDSPKMAIVQLVRGLYSLNVLKDGEAALRCFDQCESLGDEYITSRLLHYYRGCVFEDLNGDETTAISEYSAALAGKWNLDLIPCADRLARLKAIRGEIGEAIELWETAMKFDPDNAVVAWNLSTAYRDAGETEKSGALRKRLERGKIILPPD